MGKWLFINNTYFLAAVQQTQQLDCPIKKFKWLLGMEMFTCSVNFL